MKHKITTEKYKNYSDETKELFKEVIQRMILESILTKNIDELDYISISEMDININVAYKFKA